MEGKWILVNGRNRCQQCGQFVERAWLFFARPALWTHCYCEGCTADLTE